MKPYYEHGGITIYHRDVLEVLAEMPADSVDCAVTSPPYWGLRKYAGEQGEEPYGLEPTPELYVEHTMAWMRALRRVLRSTGTLWLNMGDSYAANRSYQVSDSKWRDVGNLKASRVPDGLKPLDLCGIPEQVVLAARADGWYWRSTIIWQKPNPMPESVQGWAWVWCQKRSWAYNEKTPELRRDRQPGRDFGTPTIIPCPGCPKCEANDGYVLRKGSGRPTSSFEYLYMLTKGPDYYFDTEAVREPNLPQTLKRYESKETIGLPRVWVENDGDGIPISGGKNKNFNLSPGGRNIRNVWTIATKPFSLELCQDCKRIYDQRHYRRLAKDDKGKRICRCGSTDWLSHFATFPPDLVRPCILASTSAKGNCPECGMPWARVVELGERVGEDRGGNYEGVPKDDGTKVMMGGYKAGSHYKHTFLGWRPTCSCNAGEPVPAIVLDPFSGSGTTLVVAKELGRHGIGIDLAEDYHRLAQYRLERTQPGLL